MVRVKDSLPAPVRVMFRQSTQGNAAFIRRYPRAICPPKAEARGSNPLGCATLSGQSDKAAFALPFARPSQLRTIKAVLGEVM